MYPITKILKELIKEIRFLIENGAKIVFTYRPEDAKEYEKIILISSVSIGFGFIEIVGKNNNFEVEKITIYTEYIKNIRITREGDFLTLEDNSVIQFVEGIEENEI